MLDLELYRAVSTLIFGNICQLDGVWFDLITSSLLNACIIFATERF